MKSYSERTDFYPGGYATTKGRKMQPKQIFLSERCCVTSEGRWYVRTKTGGWEYITVKKVALLAMVQNWIGGKTQITTDDITKFMDGDVPVVRGALSVPTSTAPCVEFQGSLYVNTWRNTLLPACPEAINDPALRPTLTLLMRMLREGLCGRPNELSLEAMLDAAKSDDADELQWRYLMSFLALPLQQPGINLQTNTWLLGNIGGIGKGLLTARILPWLYGAHNVAVLDAAEIEHGGWTDVIEGKLVVVVNELDAKGKWAPFWNSFLKRNSVDATVPIRKRGTHGHEAPNFANWIITSNNENQRCLDTHDRRNVLIATTTDVCKQALASNLYQWMHENEETLLGRMLGGFMSILLNHTVDRSLVERAPTTLLKTDALEANSGDGEGFYWLANSTRYARDEWLPASDYLQDYIRLTPSAAQMDARAFGGVLSGLARHGHVEREQRYKTQRALYRISSEKFPSDGGNERQKTGKTGPFTVFTGEIGGKNEACEFVALRTS
jgi:hypothetical protein